MIQAIRKRLNQKGFTLIELMVVVAILGILAAIAIPKFNESTAKANTARIQADLRTLDSAIVQYQAEEGKLTDLTLDKLNKYVNGAAQLKPPTGKCFMGKKTTDDIPGTVYGVDNTEGRAYIGTDKTNTAEKFGYREPTSSGA